MDGFMLENNPCRVLHGTLDQPQRRFHLLFPKNQAATHLATSLPALRTNGLPTARQLLERLSSDHAALDLLAKAACQRLGFPFRPMSRPYNSASTRRTITVRGNLLLRVTSLAAHSTKAAPGTSSDVRSKISGNEELRIHDSVKGIKRAM